MPDQSTQNTRPDRRRDYPPGYGTVEPVANYRPWDIDAGFQSILSDIRDHTMVDEFRLWVLWSLASQLESATVEGPLLEIGSWRGGSGALLARACNRRVYLADTFRGVVKAGGRDTYYKGGEHANTSVEAVRELLGRTGAANVSLLEGVFPEESAAPIADERFAFCHIDVDVYRSARDAFDWAWPRMSVGGIVVFDDYGFYGCEGVTECVMEIIAEGRMVIPNLTGQAVVVRTGI